MDWALVYLSCCGRRSITYSFWMFYFLFYFLFYFFRKNWTYCSFNGAARHFEMLLVHCSSLKTYFFNLFLFYWNWNNENMWMECLNLNIFQNYSSHMFLFKNPVCSNWHFTSFLKKSNLLHIIFNDFFPGHKKGTKKQNGNSQTAGIHIHAIQAINAYVWIDHICIEFYCVLCSLHSYYEAQWKRSKWRTMPKTNNSFFKIRFTVSSLKSRKIDGQTNEAQSTNSTHDEFETHFYMRRWFCFFCRHLVLFWMKIHFNE